jgi:hypothetical protein
LDITASLRPPLSASGGTKHAAEKVAKIHPPKIKLCALTTLSTCCTHEIFPARATAKSALILKIRAKLIILLALFCITKHLISFIHFLELVFITTLLIRMVLMGQFTKSFFDFIG